MTHAVAGLQPHRLDQASGQHDLAGVQAPALGGEMIGEPGQRVVRMAEHIGAAAAAGFLAVDDRAARAPSSRSGAAARATGAPSTQPAAKKSSATSVGAPMVSHFT